MAKGTSSAAPKPLRASESHVSAWFPATSLVSARKPSGVRRAAKSHARRVCASADPSVLAPMEMALRWYASLTNCGGRRVHVARMVDRSGDRLVVACGRHSVAACFTRTASVHASHAHHRTRCNGRGHGRARASERARAHTSTSTCSCSCSCTCCMHMLMHLLRARATYTRTRTRTCTCTRTLLTHTHMRTHVQEAGYSDLRRELVRRPPGPPLPTVTYRYLPLTTVTYRYLPLPTVALTGRPRGRRPARLSTKRSPPCPSAPGPEREARSLDGRKMGRPTLRALGGHAAVTRRPRLAVVAGGVVPPRGHTAVTRR